MKLSIIGTGYVGLVTGACFADIGNDVCCMDSDGSKVEMLKSGKIPIYEPGLAEVVRNGLSKGTLNFTANAKAAIIYADVIFIAVVTPMNEDGSADLSYVMAAAENIGKYMQNDKIIVIKSTVPPGTSRKVYDEITKHTKFAVKMVSCPEFLKEGKAVEDCMSPDRVIIGCNDDYSESVMRELYSSFIRLSDRIIVMDVTSAEITKYAANAMLATRISFMNELSHLCEATGADINKVRLGIGSDKRIGNSFLYAGCGYGGSCFPKDVSALIAAMNEFGGTANILECVTEVNERQKYVLVNKIVKHFGEDLQGRKFTLWGLTFKPDTDDMRCAPSLIIIEELTKRGAKVIAYDPQIKSGYAPRHAQDKYTALSGVDALILVTEWKEFKSPDFETMKNRMKTPIIFDGRNQYNAKKLTQLGFEYFCIGR